jgi:phosphopantothenoylcysteine decarboxylase/phosphopantothenate--cysteine ligase
MLKQTEKYSENSDIVIFSAAVSDFTPKKYSENKIKKQKKINNNIVLELEKTIDIAKYITEKYKQKKYKQNIPNKKIFIGFALETEKNIEQLKNIIQKKIEDKNLDYMLGNSPENLDKTEKSKNFNYLIYSKKTQNFIKNSEFFDKKTFFRNFFKLL